MDATRFAHPVYCKLFCPIGRISGLRRARTSPADAAPRFGSSQTPRSKEDVRPGEAVKPVAFVNHENFTTACMIEATCLIGVTPNALGGRSGRGVRQGARSGNGRARRLTWRAGCARTCKKGKNHAQTSRRSSVRTDGRDGRVCEFGKDGSGSAHGTIRSVHGTNPRAVSQQWRLRTLSSVELRHSDSRAALAARVVSAAIVTDSDVLHGLIH